MIKNVLVIAWYVQHILKIPKKPSNLPQNEPLTKCRAIFFSYVFMGQSKDCNGGIKTKFVSDSRVSGHF
jgi:hypothetical protein